MQPQSTKQKAPSLKPPKHPTLQTPTLQSPRAPKPEETQPCADAAEGLLPEDGGFAHRQGMKLLGDSWSGLQGLGVRL